MPSNQATPAAADPARSVNRALAALREAAEHLEEAAAATGPTDLGVASALSHVAASRAALRTHRAGVDDGAPEREAA